MIETRGMLGAVEAADAALKCASVSLLKVKKVTGGLMTVFIMGDVAAVRSAVEAASASAKRLGVSCTSHVIPRLSGEVFAMIAKGSLLPEETPSPEKDGGIPEPPEEGAPENSSVTEKGPLIGSEFDKGERNAWENDGQDAPKESATVSVPEDLEGLTVMALRRLARNVSIDTMTRKEIRFAGKAELIRELNAFFQRRKRGEGSWRQ